MNPRAHRGPFSFLSLAGVVLVVAAACGGKLPEAPAKTPGTAGTNGAAAADDPQAVFQSTCFTCHGSTGRGDGPGAAVLNPKPRSFGDKEWQASVTDEQIEKAIVFGGAAVAKSPMMPAHPQFKGKTAVLKGLVAIVRGFQGK